jgi:RNA polymerase sigma-70 factor (ECF subfamily)
MPTALDLFERHHVAVFRFLRRMELSAPDAEDLTQEVFLRVLRTVGSYEERQLERAWVFRIARNVWLDHWRARRRAPLQEPFSEPNVGTTGTARIDGLALDQALTQLGEAEREAFVMRELGGLSYLEIAEATGATADAIRNRIHRARLALRKVLGEGQALVAANRALEK